MKINELNIPFSDEDWQVNWDDIDGAYNPEAVGIKQANNELPAEDSAAFDNRPEDEELATQGHRGLAKFDRTL